MGDGVPRLIAQSSLECPIDIPGWGSQPSALAGEHDKPLNSRVPIDTVIFGPTSGVTAPQI
jgi:hypothetical protein